MAGKRAESRAARSATSSRSATSTTACSTAPSTWPRSGKADSFVWACQWLVSPAAGQQNAFKLDNLRFYSRPADEMAKGPTKYILVDPAGEKKKGSDFTVMGRWSWGRPELLRARWGLRPPGCLGDASADCSTWCFDGVRSRCATKYSMQADVQVINREMEERKHYFNIVEVGGNVAKRDRIASNLGPIVSKGG